MGQRIAQVDSQNGYRSNMGNADCLPNLANISVLLHDAGYK